jgi:hypothetical protein
LCFFLDTGTDFASHGGYNRIVLFITIFLWISIIFLGIVFYKIYKKAPFITGMFFLLIWVAINLNLKYIYTKSCISWDEGFKSTKIINDDEYDSCIIKNPKVCYYRLFDGLFDISKLIKLSCKNDNSSNQPENILPYMHDKSSKILGFPRTENFDIFSESSRNLIQKNILDKVINMEDPNIPQEIKDKIEVSVDYHQTPPKVDINIKRDEGLIKERKNKFEYSKNKVMAPNILMVFIDSLSRANFSKKLPTFWKWLEKKYISEK